MKGNYNYDVISKINKNTLNKQKIGILLLLTLVLRNLFIQTKNEFRTMSSTHEFFSKKL